jgi:hypothetical protein
VLDDDLANAGGSLAAAAAAAAATTQPLAKVIAGTETRSRTSAHDAGRSCDRAQSARLYRYTVTSRHLSRRNDSGCRTLVIIQPAAAAVAEVTTAKRGGDVDGGNQDSRISIDQASAAMGPKLKMAGRRQSRSGSHTKRAQRAARNRLLSGRSRTGRIKRKDGRGAARVLGELSRAVLSRRQLLRPGALTSAGMVSTSPSHQFISGVCGHWNM